MSPDSDISNRDSLIDGIYVQPPQSGPTGRVASRSCIQKVLGTEKLYCVRSNRGMIERGIEAEAPTRDAEAPTGDAKTTIPGYIVVGILKNGTNVPKEISAPITNGHLFCQIKKLSWRLRPFGSLLSLKHVAGFSVYECHPETGYHTIGKTSRETELTLAEMFRDYRGENHEEYWSMWIHKEFNQSLHQPHEGKYALQLVLHWSPTRLIIWGIIPILLSLGIGGWYMHVPHDTMDNLVVIQTAWGIATYIIAGGALAIAILAVITQIGF